MTEEKNEGPTEIWTRISRFRVWSANHYTIEPLFGEVLYKILKTYRICDCFGAYFISVKCGFPEIIDECLPNPMGMCRLRLVFYLSRHVQSKW